MKSMIKIIATFALLLFVGSVSAQSEWTNGSGNIYTNSSSFPNTNVGINTSTPSQDLNIIDSDGPCNVKLESGYNLASNKTLGSFMIEHTPTGDLFFTALRKYSGYNEMVQSCYDAGTSTWSGFSSFRYDTKDFTLKNGIVDVFYENTGDVLLTNSGGVGIGTTTIPSGYALAVEGKVIAEELEIQLSGSWPDYVFNKDYNLRTIEETADFINENNHLPDVPRAEEVLEEGINVGEMNALLLQKIEELTLYMIQLKEENKQLKGRIEKLEKK